MTAFNAPLVYPRRIPLEERETPRPKGRARHDEELRSAVELNDLDLLRERLRNEEPGSHLTMYILKFAIKYNNLAVVRYILESGTEASSILPRFLAGELPSYVGSFCPIPLLELLASFGWRADYPPYPETRQMYMETGQPILFYGVFLLDLNVVQWCLDHGAKIVEPEATNDEEIVSRYCSHILSMTLSRSPLCVFQFLLARGAKLVDTLIEDTAHVCCNEWSWDPERSYRFLYYLLFELELAPDLAPKRITWVYMALESLAQTANIDTDAQTVHMLMSTGADLDSSWTDLNYQEHASPLSVAEVESNAAFLEAVRFFNGKYISSPTSRHECKYREP